MMSSISMQRPITFYILFTQYDLRETERAVYPSYTSNILMKVSVCFILILQQTILKIAEIKELYSGMPVPP